MHTTAVIVFLVAGYLTEGAAATAMLPLRGIESCDGSGRRLVMGSAHVAGEAWFSLTGRVSDSAGEPICNARVELLYLSTGAPEPGPISPTGMNGEYVLDNVRKGTRFRIRVNPYEMAEHVVITEGADGLEPFLKTQRRTRSGGLARYASEELTWTDPAGVMTLDVTLQTDTAATGIVMGEWVRDRSGSSVATGVITSGAGEEIPLHVSEKFGRFVVAGVHPGQQQIRLEVDAATGRRVLSKKIVVSRDNDKLVQVHLDDQ